MEKSYPEYVFVISLHRTSTRSIDQLLKLLGYNTIHWPKIIEGENYEEKVKGKEDNLAYVWQLLDKKLVKLGFNAFSDVPYPVLYEQAEKEYPNAKFIYVQRDSKKWISSVRNLLKNKFIKGFDKVQYSPYLKLRGETKINEISDEDLVRVFEKHKSDVLNYFDGEKKEKLGSFDLSDDQVGKRICEFLGFPPVFNLPRVQEGKFPKLNNFKPSKLRDINQLNNAAQSAITIRPENPYFYAFKCAVSLKMGKPKLAYEMAESA